MNSWSRGCEFKSHRNFNFLTIFSSKWTDFLIQYKNLKCLVSVKCTKVLSVTIFTLGPQNPIRIFPSSKSSDFLCEFYNILGWKKYLIESVIKLKLFPFGKRHWNNCISLLRLTFCLTFLIEQTNWSNTRSRILDWNHWQVF